MARQIVTLEELKAEIREYGVSKMARKTRFSIRHVQRIVAGTRQPGRRFLAAMNYLPLICYLDITPKDK